MGLEDVRHSVLRLDVKVEIAFVGNAVLDALDIGCFTGDGNLGDALP
jgi:hypothetical protein